MMSEYPILFSSEMVRAILDGHKTQTRRVIKPPPKQISREVPLVQEKGGKLFAVQKQNCPYGKVGDRLWVRESFQILRTWYSRQTIEGVYLSDDSPFDIDLKEIKLAPKEWEKYSKRKWPHAKTSGRFMYKSLARIWLDITGIRVERVQDISESDAQAEGVGYIEEYIENEEPDKMWFQELWESINTKHGCRWAENPWVWVIEFKENKQ